MNDDDTYLNNEASASNAKPTAAAALLESFARTLRNAPDDRRYDIDLEVRER